MSEQDPEQATDPARRATLDTQVVTLDTRSWRFDPEPDITAYELARLLPLVTDTYGASLALAIDGLPPEVRRHVKQV